jgi:hypothetical protein
MYLIRILEHLFKYVKFVSFEISIIEVINSFILHQKNLYRNIYDIILIFKYWLKKYIKCMKVIVNN